jgi:hypothetical protein
MDLKNLIVGVIGQTLNKPTEEVSKLLYKEDSNGKLTDELREDALQLVSTKISEHIQTVKASGGDETKARNEGHQRGKKEAMEEFESVIRKEFGIGSDVKQQGAELLRTGIGLLKNSDLEESKVTGHRLYLDLQGKIDKLVGDHQVALKSKEDEFKAQLANVEILSELKQVAATEFDKLGALLPSDAEKAARQKNNFINDFVRKFQWAKDSAGIVPMSEGKRHVNAMGHGYTVATLLKDEAALLFEFKKMQGGGGGNINGEGGGGSGYRMPTTASEYNDMMMDSSKGATEKAEIFKYWQANKS